MTDVLLQQINGLTSQQPDCAMSRPTKLTNALQAFVAANEDASRSPNFQSQTGDELGAIIGLFASPAVQSHDQILLLVLKALKILSRKYDNRVRLGPLIMSDLSTVLHQRLSPEVAGEASNVVLNICYERENVTLVMQADGIPPLIDFLSSDQQDLQANAAGAIQSVCFQKEGRHFVREQGAIPSILPLLSSSSLKVKTRAVGAIHNISSEAEAIRVIRRLHGIQPLIVLLRAPSAAICGSAAGALQNLSRETAAREEIHNLGAVVPLTDLLFGEDVQSQAAIGARRGRRHTYNGGQRSISVGLRSWRDPQCSGPYAWA